MINALVAANKDFDFFVYPDRNHGIYGGNTRLHLFNMMMDFVKENFDTLLISKKQTSQTPFLMARFNIAAGHPQGLMTLFFSEMWERFCYYGMRVLLTLFLVKSLLKGDSDAVLIYGAYTALDIRSTRTWRPNG